MSYVERLVINAESKATMLYDEHLVRYRFIAPLAQNKSVLDIACGSGYGSAILAEAGAHSVIGMDLDKEAVTTAQTTYHKTNLEFRHGDATAIALPDNSIDLITSFETIEHLPNYEKYLEELKRVSSEDALVCISTPNRTVFGQKNPFHVKEFTKSEFESVLTKYFPVVRVFEQKNALSSYISGTGEAQLHINDDGGEALYFIAVCSKKEIPLTLGTVASVNVAALRRWENNPGWKLVNGFYSLLQKLKLVR